MGNEVPKEVERRGLDGSKDSRGVMRVNIGGNHILAFQAHDAFEVVAIAARHQECTLEAAQ